MFDQNLDKHFDTDQCYHLHKNKVRQLREVNGFSRLGLVVGRPGPPAIIFCSHKTELKKKNLNEKNIKKCCYILFYKQKHKMKNKVELLKKTKKKNFWSSIVFVLFFNY